MSRVDLAAEERGLDDLALARSSHDAELGTKSGDRVLHVDHQARAWPRPPALWSLGGGSAGPQPFALLESWA